VRIFELSVALSPARKIFETLAVRYGEPGQPGTTTDPAVFLPGFPSWLRNVAAVKAGLPFIISLDELP